MYKIAAIALAAGLGVASAPEAALAQSRVNIGNLSCTVDGGIGWSAP